VCDSHESHTESPTKKTGASPFVPDDILAVNLFKSVGCSEFGWMFVDGQNKKVGEYYEDSALLFGLKLEDGVIELGEADDLSLVARPKGGYVLQIDDADSEAVRLLKPFSFLIEETSKNNFQIWLSFKDERDRNVSAPQLFNFLNAMHPGCNGGSGGATRWPGCVNFKPGRNKYRVRIVHAEHGRHVFPLDLKLAGLLFQSEPSPAFVVTGGRTSWPDYERCELSKTNNEGVVDRSRADAQFTYFSLKRGFTPAEIKSKLMDLSPKAKEKGQNYVDWTVDAALKYLNLK
jgi:hypothetical protein